MKPSRRIREAGRRTWGWRGLRHGRERSMRPSGIISGRSTVRGRRRRRSGAWIRGWNWRRPWPRLQTPERRLDTRLELAETLAKAGRSAQTQGELLTTAAALPDDLGLRQRVARMLIDYGVPESAVRLLSGDTEKEHPDSATYHLLGAAEFAVGD